MSGIVKSIEKEFGGSRYTISQVARLVGRHPDTIRDWIKRGAVPPPTEAKPLGSGEQFVWLYTPELVSAYIAYSETIKVGRPSKTA